MLPVTIQRQKIQTNTSQKEIKKHSFNLQAKRLSIHVTGKVVIKEQFRRATQTIKREHKKRKK